MPISGKTEAIAKARKSVGDFSKNPLYAYASKFAQLNKRMVNEGAVDYTYEPAKALSPSNQICQEALKEFFVEDSFIKEGMTAEEVQDNIAMSEQAFNNDAQQLRESAVMGMATYNPMVGLSLPMHKYLMLNCVFAQALPRFVAATPLWTETMETRYLITPEGKRIDIANQQNMIFDAWKSQNRPVEVGITLPEVNSVDILDKYFHVPRTSHNLSVATHICAVAVEEWVKTGTEVIDTEVDGSIKKDDNGEIKTKKAESDGKALVWKPWKAEFRSGYGEYNRVIMDPVDMILTTDAAGTTEVFHDSVFASQKDNMFEINASKIKAVKLWARYDASSRMLKTCRVEWQERTTPVQIPEADGITIPVTPEEIKDVGANYGINQVTKYMSMIKDVLENVKDDDIKEFLDVSYASLTDDQKLQATIDMAPREGYYESHLKWLQDTFMNTLDQSITGLLSVLRDPNMQICVIGRPGIIRQITPTSYTYSTPSNVGAIELDFKKTVVTSDKRVYNFISSDKLFGNDNLIVLLIPKNSNRIVYRLYDYQMYISNEIRDAENPALPALTAFQRYKCFEYQPVQARLFCANPTGLREHLPNIDGSTPTYSNNDLQQYKHYDATTGRNVATKNVLP